MLREMPTPEMPAQWNEVWRTYAPRLRPNRRSGAELAAFLRENYAVTQVDDARMASVVAGNVLDNAHFRDKLPAGRLPEPVVFTCRRGGETVWIGIDLASGMYHVEDDAQLWDALCAFQGLDEADLRNPYCVFEYVSCLKKFGRLEAVVHDV